MRELSENDFNSKMEEIQRDNIMYQRKQLLRIEKRKYRPMPKIPSTSKLMSCYLFIMLNIVLIFAMIAMWHFQDLTYLGVLITDIGAQLLTYVSYNKKSTAENTSGGIIYETAMLQAKQAENSTDDDGEEAVG